MSGNEQERRQTCFTGALSLLSSWSPANLVFQPIATRLRFELIRSDQIGPVHSHAAASLLSSRLRAHFGTSQIEMLIKRRLNSAGPVVELNYVCSQLVFAHSAPSGKCPFERTSYNASRHALRHVRGFWGRFFPHCLKARQVVP